MAAKQPQQAVLSEKPLQTIEEQLERNFTYLAKLYAADSQHDKAKLTIEQLARLRRAVERLRQRQRGSQKVKATRRKTKVPRDQ